MKRLFFALWPDKKTRKQIDAVNQQIDLPSVRKLRPANLHNTLLYLGNLDAKSQKAIVEEASKIQVPAFTFALDGLQYWKTPKVLCLTTSQHPPAMLALVNQLVAIAEDYPMIYLHDRPYQAHVTLMRKAKSGYPLAVATITWQAKDFVLVESVSTPKGIRYDILERWPLMAL